MGYRRRTDWAKTPATDLYSPSPITRISSAAAFESYRKIVAKRASWLGPVCRRLYLSIRMKKLGKIGRLEIQCHTGRCCYSPPYRFTVC